MNNRLYGLSDFLASFVYLNLDVTIDEIIKKIDHLEFLCIGESRSKEENHAKEVFDFVKIYKYSNLTYEDIKEKGKELYRPEEEIQAIYDRIIAIYPKYLTYKNPYAKYYAISDIHGYLDILNDTVKNIRLRMNDKLIFLGDYIDGGPHSRQTLEYLYNLQKQFPENVIVLKGNHEDMFVDWFENNVNIGIFQKDEGLNTLKTFLKDNQFDIIVNYLRTGKTLYEINNIVKKYIKKNYPELIKWLKELPLYYETEKQIFVHAGVDEEAGEYWKYGAEDYYYMWKYPHTTGKFYKDIIAGHIGVSEIAGDKNFHDIYFDGESHYYLDSAVEISQKLNLIIYDTETNKYIFK